MKALLITASYPPVRGGVADYTQHLAHALADLGHEVQVLTSWAPEPPLAENVAPPIRVIRGVRCWGPAGISAVTEIVRQCGPDVIGLQYVPMMYGRGGVAPGIALLPFPLRRATHASIVAVLHELALSWSLVPRQMVQAIAHRAQLGLLGLGCDRFVVTNRAYAERLSFWVRPQRVVSVIPVGSNILPVAVAAGHRATVRERLGAGSGPLLGSLSALSVGDHPEHLVTVLQRAPAARLAFLGGLPGDSSRRPAIARLARSAGVAARMRWTGYLPEQALSQALTALDVYVHTRGVGASTRSTALAAALAHGLPIVAYRGPETTGLFVDGENILLAPRGNPWALAERVAQVLASSDLRARLAAGAHELYRRHFTWAAIAQRFVAAAA
jgi:glycosyltransferase involved in cell wall biosynthesis